MTISSLKSKILTNLINKGSKTISEKLLKKSIKNIQKISRKNHIEILKKALINSSPVMTIKKIGKNKKKSREFPYLISKKLRLSSGLKYILETLKNKQKIQNFYNEFSTELILTSQNKSTTTKLKNNVHEQTFLKKKYANFRWF
jgi:small subunit ribosomal protein S7